MEEAAHQHDELARCGEVELLLTMGLLLNPEAYHCAAWLLRRAVKESLGVVPGGLVSRHRGLAIFNGRSKDVR